MPQPRSPHTQEVIQSIAGSREAFDRAWSEWAELKAVTWEAIAKSRELMAKVDTALAKWQRAA